MACEMACTAQDIIELNKTKEYLVTASYLLQKVTTDQNLNAQATMLWQILFNKAKFDENLEIQISCSYLAQMLGKSTRTIQRYIKTLADNKYIVIINNYLNHGGQMANTIQVRFPADKIQEAKKTKNRITSNNIANETKPDRIYQNKEPDIKTIQKTIQGAKTTVLPLAQIQNKDDKNVVGEGDKNVVENNIININNIKTNNNGSNYKVDNNHQDVVSDISYENCKQEKLTQVTSNPSLSEELTKLEDELKLKQEDLTELKKIVEKATKEEMMLHSKNIIISYKKLRTNNQLRTKLDLCETNIYFLKKTIKEKENLFKKHKAIEEDPNYIATKEGIRPIAKFTYNRLNKCLQNLGYQNSQKIRLINEIIFEARFGSLINTNTDKTEMPIEKSINIALKLVREGRWYTPAYFVNNN